MSDLLFYHIIHKNILFLKLFFPHFLFIYLITRILFNWIFLRTIAFIILCFFPLDFLNFLLLFLFTDIHLSWLCILREFHSVYFLLFDDWFNIFLDFFRRMIRFTGQILRGSLLGVRIRNNFNVSNQFFFFILLY